MIRRTGVRLGRAVMQAVGAADEITVIPPWDSGGVGDQAMVDATVGALVRRHGRRVVVRHITPVDHPILLRSSCTYHRRLEAVDKAGLVGRFATLREEAGVALGADVIDGTYGRDAELRRLDLLAVKMAQGKPAAVLGCSISQQPDPEVMARIRALPGLIFNLRDEISLARFEAAVGRPGRLVADVAFLLEPGLTTDPARAAADWIAGQRAAGRFVLGVNASGHTVEKMQGRGAEAHVAALGRWLGADPARAVLLAPHDFRPAPTGDVEAVEAIGAGLAGFADRVRVLRPPFNAWDLKALMGRIDALLTGRMHLSIAALGMGTPALCVVYAGKYEGLMRHFRLEGMLMEPSEMLATDAVVARLERLTAEAAGLRTQVEARLPEVTALAERNFEWLPSKRR